MIIARPIGVCSPLPIVKDPNGPGIDASSITSGTIDAARLPSYIAASPKKCAVIFGDSRAAGGNYSATGATISVSGTTVTVTLANHLLFEGQPFFIDGFGINGVYDSAGLINGSWVVASRVSSSVFTYTIPAPVSGSVAAYTGGGSTPVISDIRVNDRNALVLANSMMGNQISTIINRGTSGQFASICASRFNRDVVNAKLGGVSQPVGVIWIRGPGINDINNGNTSQSVKDAYASMFAQWQAMPNRPLLIVSDIMPVSGTNSPTSATYSNSRRDARLDINRWIRRTVKNLDGAVMFNEHALMCDSIGAGAGTVDFRTGYSFDGAHESSYAAFKSAIALSSLISPYFSTAKNIDVDAQADSQTSTQKLYNPLLTGSNSAASTGITGTSANGVQILRKSGSPSVACTSGVSRSDEKGFDQQLVITSSAANDAVLCVLGYPTLTAGKSYRISCHLKITQSVNLSEISFYLTATWGGVAAAVYAMSTTGGAIPDGDYDLVLKSPVFKIPDGVTISGSPAVRLDFAFSGAGGDGATTNVYRFGCMTVDQID